MPYGTSTVHVTHNGGREAFEDAKGQFLYFTKQPPVHGVWRFPVAGGEESPVTDQGSQGRWALGAHGIYYLKGETELERHAWSDRSTLSISTAGLQLATGTGGLLAIGPEERSLLVTASVRTESGLMMVERFR